MTTKRAVRVVDVAKAADCSSATVSRAINSPDKVSAEIVKRVIAAVESLGYTPNHAARALRSRRTRTCGAVLPTLNHSIYARVATAVEARLGEAGYSLLVTNSEFDPVRELQQTRILVERGAEGLVLVGDSHDRRLYELLETRNIPFINTYVFNPSSGHPCAGFDNRRSAAQIVDFLIQLGHSDIAVISGIATDNDRVLDRVEGIRQTLQSHGLSLPRGRVVEERYTPEGGYEGMRRLLSGADWPTAIVCFSDIVAVGALAMCQDRGLSVPDEMSIVGFDNLEYAAHVRPALTTLEVSAVDMGRQAADYLIQRLQGLHPGEYWQFETKLIVRSTTRPPKVSTARRAWLERALGSGSVGPSSIL